MALWKAGHLVVKEGGIPGKKFMQNHIIENRQRIKERKSAKVPWIVRIFMLLGALIQWLAKCIWRFSRRNVPLALGMALFIIVFALVAYNAFFRQNMVARPVLFSTRAALHARNKAQNRPFVEKAISTEALDNNRSSVPAPILHGRAVQSRDTVAAFIAADEKKSGIKNAEQKMQKRAGEARPRASGTPVAVPDAKPRAENMQNGFLPGEERVLRVQKALQKAGQNNLAVNGMWDTRTHAAVLRFQKSHALAPTGKIDEALIAKMRNLHLW